MMLDGDDWRQSLRQESSECSVSPLSVHTFRERARADASARMLLLGVASDVHGRVMSTKE